MSTRQLILDVVKKEREASMSNIYINVHCIMCGVRTDDEGTSGTEYCEKCKPRKEGEYEWMW